MTAKYFAILTNQGAARLANAAALGTKLNLTQMAVGDANGTLPTPDPAQTKLINQKRIAPLNLLTVDPANTSQIIAEQIIPENEGGFWIREIGLYDDDGILIAVANCPETYKPQLQEGSGRTQTIRMILIVSSTSAITLKIDPSVVLATRKYVDDKVIEVKAYADSLLAAHLAAENPHSQYLKIADIAKYTPVGVPLPFPSATPPTGWLKCNGAAFDKAKYPGLAAVFPSGNLPDLRGEFIRGWDDGRGVDSGRELLSTQGDAIRNITGKFGQQRVNSEINAIIDVGYASGAFSAPRTVRNNISTSLSWDNSRTIGQDVDFSAGNVVPTANENRPRSVAFNFIVRAA
ncbi:phage tail protein [Escherichia coli]|uniref:phage tail protein n=1 Tax=Escherichia coli TaxID=562 RepID=UPI0017FD975E|nr:phage tail protein [Escherichia coli]EFH5727472.1 phage tail protein [Escherichia coli]EFH6812046.1 phage tail protein [Escherichia coli]EGY7812528.1 phage tail protein [Escherichia coli]EHH4415058.1 phage tail protein [Escherichia coli]